MLMAKELRCFGALFFEDCKELWETTGNPSQCVLLTYLFIGLRLHLTSKDAKKKKTRPISSHFDLSLVNNAYEYISCRLIQIWQGKTVQKMHF